MSYDAKGRLTQEGERSYAWDEDDRLSAITEGNASLGQYGYDVFGLRRSAVRASGISLFVHDSDGNLLAETDADGVVLREYVYLDGQRLALFDLTNSDAAFYQAVEKVDLQGGIIPYLLFDCSLISRFTAFLRRENPRRCASGGKRLPS